MSDGPMLRLTLLHDELLRQLAETRAARTGADVDRARRSIELEVMRLGLVAVQRLEADSVAETDGGSG
jgi:hypothetical protein